MVLEKTHDSPLDWKIKSVSPKGNQSWIRIRRTDAEAEPPILWPSDAKNWLVGKDPEGRRWKGWQRMRCWLASPTRWRWAWVGSGSWWWTGRPGVLQFMGSQRVGHDWATELNWTETCQQISQESTSHRYCWFATAMLNQKQHTENSFT